MARGAPSPIAAKLFGDGEQRAFALLSGDRNPMHMDAVAARRTQVGVRVVHGMHPVLWALDELAKAERLSAAIGRVRVKFTTVAHVGDVVALDVTRHTEQEVRAQLRVGERVITSLIVSFGARPESPAGVTSDSTPPERAWPEHPIERSLDELHGLTGSLRFAEPSSAVAAAFPAATRHLGATAVSGLACLSRLVGMACPGLHSIFAAFDVTLTSDGGNDETIRHRVESVDDRFRVVTLGVEGGGVRGSVEAFARVPPVSQASIAELSTLVTPGEFAGSTALILGGSRGLGEVCAKLLAAGGARTIVTYAVGATEAARVRDEIRSWGTSGPCEAMAYDVRQPAEPQLAAMNATPTSLYYFATAPIFVRRTTLYSAALYEEAHRFYVQGFYDLCVALRSSDSQPLSVFYPSSIAVTERPAELTEYAMAKAAGEVLCADMTRFMPGLRVAVSRLPRMSTDQTASVMPAEALPPATVMLPIVRDVESVAQKSA